MKLVDYLAKHQLSHREFADRIGVSQASITRYALGQRVPRPAHLQKIREVTKGKVTFDDFVEPYADQRRAS